MRRLRDKLDDLGKLKGIPQEEKGGELYSESESGSWSHDPSLQGGVAIYHPPHDHLLLSTQIQRNS